MLCILAKLDDESRKKLAEIQKTAEDFGLPVKELHGHVTLACYIGGSEEQFIQSCREKVGSEAPFKVIYDRIDVFETSSCIVAEPRKEQKIENVHREISCKWSDDLNSWTKDNVWLPHTTLVQFPGADPEVLNAAADAMRKNFKPFEACVTELEFSRVLDGGRYEIADTIKLK